jgi:hypothetical protein
MRGQSTLLAHASPQAGVVDDDGDMHAIGGAELGEQPRDVRLHGRLAHVQLRSHLGVGRAGADRDGDLAVALAAGIVRTVRREIK